MAVATSFEEANVVLDKPDDMTRDECEALSVARGQLDDGTPVVISCWKITPDELIELTTTGRIWLMCWGTTMPPVHLGCHKAAIFGPQSERPIIEPDPPADGWEPLDE